MSNIRFGDYRYRQSKVQQHRRSEAGSGRRRADPSVHATSRAYHTSAPGIRMNVTQNAQLASQMNHPIQQKYLNQMKTSEQAQQKVNRATEEEGRQYDKNGLAMLRGLRHSQGRGKMNGPNQDAINRMAASIAGQEASLPPRPADINIQQRQLAEADDVVTMDYGGGRLFGGAVPRQIKRKQRQEKYRRVIREQNIYDRQVAAITGMKKKLKGGNSYNFDHHKYKN